MSKILVIDDDGSMCRLLADGLRTSGTEVEWRLRGEEALDRLCPQRLPDALLGRRHLTTEPLDGLPQLARLDRALDGMRERAKVERLVDEIIGVDANGRDLGAVIRPQRIASDPALHVGSASARGAAGDDVLVTSWSAEIRWS